MEEEKSLPPPQAISKLKALAVDCAAPVPNVPGLRKTLAQYKEQSQKHPAPSFLGKRLYLAETLCIFP